MAIHTIGAAAGRRVQVKQSPTSPGRVLLQVLSADREVLASVTLDPDGACVMAVALEHEAAVGMPVFRQAVAP